MERGKVVNPVAGKALAIGGISIYFQGWVGGFGGIAKCKIREFKISRKIQTRLVRLSVLKDAQKTL